MRLVLKLTLVIGLGLLAVLVVGAYLRVRREVAMFQDDMRHDHRALGQTVARAVAEVWKLKGRKVALDVVAHANAAHASVAVRWVRPDAAPGSSAAARVPSAALASLRKRTSTDLIVDEGDGLFCSYVPVGGPGSEYGALEITEPLSHQRQYVRTTVAHTVVTTGVMAIVAFCLAFLVGAWIVGRPVHALEAKARRVGGGDLSGPLELTRRDELAGLARELNSMCDHLAEAREHAAAETAARIATLEQLRHADRLSTIGKLAAGVAHELGTPLNVVQGRADMIQTGEATGDEALDSARIIKEQAQRMARIVRELMRFARHRELQRTATDLSAVARDTIELLAPVAEKRQVKLELAATAQPIVVPVDPALLQQSLANLVMNAVQASPAGSRVELDVQRCRLAAPVELGGAEGDYALVTVSDHGQGMAPDVAGRVFEPFFTTKDVGEGTGLGLAVSYGIIRDHGGWISVETEPGQGSVFTVHIPETPQA